jgi:hypothetical protein
MVDSLRCNLALSLHTLVIALLALKARGNLSSKNSCLSLCCALNKTAVPYQVGEQFLIL